jgi:phenylalanyl-tRNA synthetase beta chain
MRSSLIASLVQVLRYNLARKAPRVRVFEIGRVFRRDADAVAGDASVAGIAQPMRVAGLAYGAANALQWGAPDTTLDFHDVKGDLESLFAPAILGAEAVDHPALHPGRAAQLRVDGRVVGVVGELHPRWRQAFELTHPPIVFEIELDALLDRPLPAVEPVARHQAVLRDVALVVPEVATHDELVSALRADPAGLIRSATLFDIYRPKSVGTDSSAVERSMAVRLELQDDTTNLTEAAIDSCIAAAIVRAAVAVGARLRS